ncbi:MAG TPA: DUF2959 family protein [Bdellovibrionales bacterium]|nr:DUF2959 family protein [Bdellovibrionales bacterium]
MRRQFRQFILNMRSRPRPSLNLLLMLLALTACQNPVKKAIRNTQYSAYELVGVQKRDLLKTRVEDARDDQKEAGEEFTDALTQLKKVYGFDGGDLEREYDQLRKSYERTSHQAEDVQKSIRRVETVAQDLFDEWEAELKQIETPALKTRSQASLSSTKARFEELRESLKASEARMAPVLRKFNDHVLYLKHNLNARAISSLKGEALKISNDIESLIADMNKSIASSNKFIESMPQ